MTILLGVDPGSRITGYGLINAVGNQLHYIDSGCIRAHEGEWAERLAKIFDGLNELIERHCPQEMAIEQVFMARNADSALKLGQARGVAILAGAKQALPVAEYSAKQIKQAVVGKGGAQKSQVQHMVAALLDLPGKPQADAADALAVALCHAHTRQSLIRLAGHAVPVRQRFRQGRMR